jgi:hypothetical protein
LERFFRHLLSIHKVRPRIAKKKTKVFTLNATPMIPMFPNELSGRFKWPQIEWVKSHPGEAETILSAKADSGLTQKGTVTTKASGPATIKEQMIARRV